METTQMNPEGKNEFMFALQLVVICFYLLQSTKIVAEQIKPIQQIKSQVVPSEVTELSGDEFNTTANTSSLVYIISNDKVYNDTCVYAPIKNCTFGPAFGITSISFLVPHDKVTSAARIQTSPMSTDTLTNLYEERDSPIHSIILSLTTNDAHSNNSCSCHAYHLSILLSNNLGVWPGQKSNSSVKLGFEYDNGLIECCPIDLDLHKFGMFELAVLRIQLSPFQDLLSYGLFVRKLDALVQKNREFVNSFNPECTLYIHMVFPHFANISKQANLRFKAILSDYARSWKEEYNSTEIFILPVLPETVSIQDNDQFLKTNIIPTIKFQHYRRPARELKFWVVQDIPNVFDNVAVRFENNYNDPTLILSRLSTISFQTKANLSILLPFVTEDTRDIVKVLADNAEALNIRTVYLETGFAPFKTDLLRDILTLLQAKNIEFGCQPTNSKAIGLSKNNSMDLVDHIKVACGELHNVSSKLLYHRQFTIETQEYLEEILWTVEQERQLVQEAFPGKQAQPQIELTSDGPAKSVSVFCSEYKKNYNEYYNTIIAFANVNGWSNVHLRYLVEPSHETWWQFIEVESRIRTMVGNTPAIVRTNEAKQLDKKIRFPNTFTCVDWSKVAPQPGIPFLKTGQSGTIIQMDLKPNLTSPNTKELETLLLFAFGKFPNVQLIAKREHDITTAAEVLTGKLLEFVRNANNLSLETNLVYMEIPMDLAIHSQKSLRNLNNKVALHFTEWENHTSSAQKFNFDAFAKRRFGITVANCADEVNSNLTRLTTLPFFPFINFVVCDEKGAKPDNSNEYFMDEYLNTMFYIKLYMNKFLPNVGINFRLSVQDEKFCGSKKPNTEPLLRFLNDVHQQGAAYKIQYFIVNAFAREDRQNECSASWWRIDNYTDLSNTAVYTDVEEDYFDRRTFLQLRPALIQPDKNNKENGGTNVVISVTISILSFVLFLSVVALLVNHKRMRKQILSQKEIIEFYNGTVNNKNSEEDQEENYEWLGMGFPKHLRIRKKRIELGNLIGSGEFGKVFAGKLDKEINVAVKVPRQSASPETIKSALSEVKILCFVGDGTHPNVISFIGAYTKEISQGKLYILTEYCDNGSLLSFLRAQQAEKDKGASLSVDLFQMFRVAAEIASGMEYISGKRVIHGDLATRNIMLTTYLTCKISDFGLSRQLYEYAKYVKEGHEPLPWKWMAIETLDKMEFTTKSDVWSYGVTVWEIFSLGAQPYPGLSWTPGYVNDLQNGMRMARAKYASDAIHEKLLECWSEKPPDRPTFDELAQFFGELRSGVYTPMHNIPASDSSQLVASAL